MKSWVDKKTGEKLKFKAGFNNKEYKVESIYNDTIYVRKLEASHLSDFYYLALWKNYLEDQNTWKFASEVQYLRKLLSIFYKNYFDKLTIIFLPIDSALSITKRTAKT